MVQVGQTVGNYQVTAKIGEGGMGAVYLAEHPVIGRKAALKVIHPQHARNPDVVARFVNEASAISRIGHEHIVDVTDFGRTPDGDFYFTMEYLEGEPLSELISREAPIEPARALEIAAQIADALSASHAHGVVHRDLKPENIFLVARGQDPAFVKVLDFGLAKLLDGDGAAAHQTRTGIVMGTPYYMAPEQCEGRAELDGRADVYALGVVLFEMLTGKLPFGGNYGQVLMKQMTMRPPAARSLVPSIPEELELVLQRALAKDPDQRFPTMAALRDVLLDPANHGATPDVSIHDDLSGRLRAAEPLSRAEIRQRRTPAPRPPTTLGHGAGQLASDAFLDRIPRHRGARVVGVMATALLAGAVLAAGLTHRSALWPSVLAASAPAPRTISVSFSSDPDGATVVDPTGATLGVTPLSIQVTPTQSPAEYVFKLDGFATKTIALIPNVPSSMFAHLDPAAPPEETPAASSPEADEDPQPERRVATASRHHHEKTADRLLDDPDEDGVLAPSFAK
jgi:serine/threonine protein kinase